jgi:hypothetical protein
MNTIEKVLEKLKYFPELKYKVEDALLTIVPTNENGFQIWLSIENKDETIVGFEGDHYHINNEDEAIRCFFFGLSDSCRLEVTSRGNFDYKWKMQHNEDGRWKTINTTGLLWFIPFWKKKTIRYLQNYVIKEKTEPPSMIPV